MKKELLPLHPAQRDVFTDQLLNPKSTHYNIGGYIKIKGPLNRAKFNDTIISTAQIFDAFKFRFSQWAGEPVFYFDDQYIKPPLHELDFTAQTDAVAHATNWITDRFNTPVVLSYEEPPFEEYLLKISANEHWFFGKYHHLVTDGYGFILYLKYIGQKYKSLTAGEATAFDYLPYKTEAINASAYFTSPGYDLDKTYWKSRIGTMPENLLEKKYTGNDEGDSKGTTYVHQLTGQQQIELAGLQTATRCGIQQLTIAAMIIYLAKTTGRSAFVFGLPLHRRSSRKLRSIVGMFSGVLPFKGWYSDDKLLGDLLKEILQAQKKDYRHQDFLTGDLARSLKATATQDFLYQISIDFEPFNLQLDMGDGLQAVTERVSVDHDKNPLQLCWLQYGDDASLKLELHYSKAYFNEPEVALLSERLLFILEQFSTALNSSLAAIAILPAQEKLLIESFNAAPAPYPKDKTLVDLFEAQVLKKPSNIALLFGRQQFTYYELNGRSNQLATYLKGMGVKEETLVPLCINRSVEMIVAILGILKAGAAYVPIDPAYPAERISFMLGDIGSSIIVTAKACVNNLSLSSNVQYVLLDEDWPVISKSSGQNLNIVIKPNQLAYIIYTSGSTGKPKGVMVEHGGVVNLITAQSNYFEIGAGENILQFSNYCFDASVEQIFLALFNGAALVLITEGLLLSMDGFTNFLNENKITHLHATPAFIEQVPAAKYSHLKRVIAGGDTCKKDLAAQWQNLVTFYNEYGPTETTVTAIELKADENYQVSTIALPIGKPIANTRLFIADKIKNLLPVGVAGELYMAGAGVARGYLNRPELTAEKFIVNCFNVHHNEMMYATGDLARWLPDGTVEYLGRVDEQVKIRGYRVELGEIEYALQEFETVKQAVVVARTDKDGQKKLVAFVVVNSILNQLQIQSGLRKKLPDYMVPSQIVSIENIPLSANGKVDKKALPDVEHGNILSNEYQAPATELEIKLADLWKAILGVDKIGIHDNFFELGGHSLHAIQLTSRMHQLLNIKADAGIIFSHPTLKQLSEALLLEKQNQFVAIPSLPLQATYPLSHAQKRFWVLSHFKDGSAAYNVANAFIIEGKLDMGAFKKAFASVIERHEILRTIFIEVNGEPRQQILAASESNFNIEEHDLRNNPNAAAFIKQQQEAGSRQTFDLAHGPLLRVVVNRIADDRFVLLFCIHHIISDGWSKGILIKEVLTFYKNYSSNNNAPLPSLPVQYKDYAAWHNAMYQTQAGYWRQKFINGIPKLNFLTDFERPKVLTFFGAMIMQRITPSLTQSLRNKAIEHNISLNNLLFALYGLLLARRTNQPELVIGSLSSGRSHIDLENLAGVFINFLPVRLSIQRQMDLNAYLSSSNKALVEAYNHQDYPFDLMVEDCIKQRDVSRNPFFDTMVNFHLQNDLIDKNLLANNDEAGAAISIAPYQANGEDAFQSVLDFKLDIEINDEALELFLSYNSKLFLSATMYALLDEYIELLTAVVTEPAKNLNQYGTWQQEPVATLKETNDLVETTPVLPLNICSSFVMEPVQEYVEYWSKEFDLNIKIAFAPYNQVFQQLIDPLSLLNSNEGINAVFIRVDDWLRDHKSKAPSEQLAILNNAYTELISLLAQAGSRLHIPFLVAIVPLLNTTSVPQLVAAEINKLNQQLEAFIQQQQGFHLLSLPAIAALYDVQELYDAKADELGHMPFTPELYAAAGTWLTRKVNAIKGTGYKVIAVDCDNTLWQGIVGEAGATGVIIDENFKYFQQFLIRKYTEGFLLVICSKNNEADVWEVFNSHPHMLLKKEHIAAHRINWQPKPSNLASIASQLNLGMSSFIFLDDSEFEIEQMDDSCPEVLSIALPVNPAELKSFLDHIWAFDRFAITGEDAKRNQMYQVEKQRKDEQDKFGNLNDFLATLGLQVSISPLTKNELDRAVQLTLRTNQFNLNGIRKNAAEITTLMQQPNTINWFVEVQDRFGEYGIAGLVLAKNEGNTLLVDTLLLSCRVLGRNVEDHILASLLAWCTQHGLNNISASYQPTDKNKPILEFLQRTGWVPDASTNIYNYSKT